MFWKPASLPAAIFFSILTRGSSNHPTRPSVYLVDSTRPSPANPLHNAQTHRCQPRNTYLPCALGRGSNKCPIGILATAPSTPARRAKRDQISIRAIGRASERTARHTRGERCGLLTWPLKSLMCVKCVIVQARHGKAHHFVVYKRGEFHKRRNLPFLFERRTHVRRGILLEKKSARRI